MALADHFDEADVLDSVMWAGMTLDARIAKLANLYVRHEKKISEAHRNYKGPTVGTVKVFVKSYCTPPRGVAALTYEGVVAAIPAQREKVEARKQQQPWTFKVPKLAVRHRKVAERRYTITSKSRYGGGIDKHAPAVVAVTQIAGCLAIIDKGGYSVYPRVYLKNKVSGAVKIVVCTPGGDRPNDAFQVLARLTPSDALAGMFSGVPVTLDFEGEGWLVGGKLVPWANVVHVYRKAKATRKPIRTDATPKGDA